MSAGILKDWRLLPPGKEKYQLYLASREWAVLKEIIRKRSGGVCERCRFLEAAHVHHQTYERIYEERPEDLAHLCIPCHEYVSGKRDADPILLTPVRLSGRVISKVYMAGKITGTTWRDEIVLQGWSFENHSAINFDLCKGRWETTLGCLPIPDGRLLDLTGPYWRPVEGRGGHGHISDSIGFHCFGMNPRFQHGEAVGFDSCLDELTVQIQAAIDDSDLLFAWIDSPECYGTLVEIGYAKAKGIIVAAFCPVDFKPEEFWMAFKMADVSGKAPSPGDAWSFFWADILGQRLPSN